MVRSSNRSRRSARRRGGKALTPRAPRWIVTYTDMVSLLVTFFVLMMTFSTMKRYDVLLVDAWLNGDPGVLLTEGNDLVGSLEMDLLAATDTRRGHNQAHSRPQEALLENIEEMGQMLTDDHIEVDLNDPGDGIVIRFDGGASFAPGSDVPTPELERCMDEMGRVLQHYPHMIVVEGFTDGAFRATTEHPSAEALALARAEAAVAHLIGGSETNPLRVQIAGIGQGRPRATNDRPAGRLLNRRIEVRILSLSLLRTTHLESLAADSEGSDA